jgi:hypothetical protein
MDIISYKTPYTNNHILNTVLIKYCEQFFGSSELMLRLPNIAACLLYIVYAIKLLRKMAPALLIPGFIILMVNIHLVDFFSLARGYGLSFAFMLMSIYHLIHYFSSSQKKDLLLFNAGAFFAVLSNFSLINYYVSALVVYNMFLIYKSRLSRDNTNPYHFYKINRIHLGAMVVFIAVLYEPLRRISKQGMLDFGGKEGFLEDTFGSLIKGVFYETPLSMNVYVGLKIAMLAILVLTGIIIARTLFRKERAFVTNHSGLAITYLILLGIIVLSYVQHLLIHNDFYTGRFALFIYPLFMLHVIFLMNYLCQGKYRLAPALFLYSISILLVISFSSNMNLRFYQDWKYDSGTKTVVNIISNANQQQTDRSKKISLGINWLFEPTVNFYRYTQNLGWLKQAHRKGISGKENYLYLFESDTNAYLTKGKPLRFLGAGINTILVKNDREAAH